MVLAKGALSIGCAADVALRIANAMCEAEKHGVIHRDLKPGNILVVKQTGDDLLEPAAATSSATASNATASNGTTSPLPRSNCIAASSHFKQRVSRAQPATRADRCSTRGSGIPVAL